MTESDAPFIYTLLGDALLRLRDSEQAVDILEEASTLWPDNEQVQLRLGTALAMAGSGAEAMKVLQPYLDKHPEDHERLFVALRILVRSEVSGPSDRLGAEDRALFERYAASYAAAKDRGGPSSTSGRSSWSDEAFARFGPSASAGATLPSAARSNRPVRDAPGATPGSGGLPRTAAHERSTCTDTLTGRQAASAALAILLAAGALPLVASKGPASAVPASRTTRRSSTCSTGSASVRRPGDVERVRQIGLQAYIDQQLQPEKVDDPHDRGAARVARDADQEQP